MKVSVLGLGYVGSVTAACLASQDHDVVGVDINPDKLELISSGRSPVVEPGLNGLISEAVRSGTLTVTSDPIEGIQHGDVSLICVGTPSKPNGDLSIEQVERVFKDIGHGLSQAETYKTIALRSTVLPGVLVDRLIPILSQESGKQLGDGYGVAINPEFLREGKGIEDFKNPPFTLIGEIDRRDGDQLASLYGASQQVIYRTDPDTACMVKYASNAFHALKVGFGNEIGRVCNELGMDGSKVMEIFRKDDKLNISDLYLMPGFAFGGSCLPKDLRALIHLSRHIDVSLPILEAVLPSNERQLQVVVDSIIGSGKRHIGIIGLAYKPHTDDLRESPMVRLAETLLGKGLQLRIYDAQVSLSRLVGSNKAYIDQVIPHLAELLCDSLEDAIATAEVIVSAQALPEELIQHIRSDQDLLSLGHTSLNPPQDLPISQPGIV